MAHKRKYVGFILSMLKGNLKDFISNEFIGFIAFFCLSKQIYTNQRTKMVITYSMSIASL